MSDRKILISNFLSLSSVQAINYILPLATVPYLVRVLGPEKFGLIAFSQAFIQYFVLTTNYGFNLSATREISINRDNKNRISEIFSTVIIIKIIFMVLSFLILLLVLNINKFRDEWLVYLLTFGTVVGNVLFPVWFFQGMERMKQIAMANILARVIFTISIFIFIKHQSDYIYVPLINSLGFIVAGIISLWIAFRKFKIKIKIPNINEIKYEIKEGWHIFISTIAISLYTITNTFILGLFTNYTIVGYYSAGEKIIKAFQGFMWPVTQTIYPHISKLASDSKEIALTFIRKMVKLMGSSNLLLSSALFIFAPQISEIILGSQFKESIPIIRILSFLPFIIVLSNIFAIQVMLNFGLKKIFSKIFITAGIINITLAIILVKPLQHIGIATSLLITEIFVTCISLFIIQSHGLKVVWGRIPIKVNRGC